jgi:hypothetical protein
LIQVWQSICYFVLTILQISSCLVSLPDVRHR